MKHKRVLSAGVLLVFMLAFSVAPAFAQTYLFQVESSQADVFVDANGMATVEYTYVFANDSSADPIDFVDIGLPTNNYSLSNVSAEVNGKTITSIEESPYVTPGVALGLQSGAIQPGARGTVHVTVTNIGRLIYKTNKVSDVQEDYASFEFMPNSFGSEFVRGSTAMTVTLHLPPGLNSDEPRWFTPQGWPGSDEPTSGYDDRGGVFYRWEAANASSSAQYTFGSAFPARLVPAEVLVTEPVLNTSVDLSGSLCPMVFCLGFFGFMALVIYGSVTADKKRKLQYLPPKISLEGNGIKRGLTAVEAAVLMEQPLDKLLSMILFSLVKKGGAEVLTKEPLKIKALPEPQFELYAYETDFLHAMTAESKAETRRGLQAMMVALVRSVAEKMRGFSRKETLAYYEEIMKRAWDQMTAAGTPEVQMKAFDEAMEWTMLDRKYEDRSRDVFGPRTVFVPMWWGHYDPGFNRSAPAAGASTFSPRQVGSAPGSSNLPSLPGSEFAASVAGGIQNFASNVVGDITSFTSGVTNTTNPLPKPTASSGSRGGGGGGRSCACACACAGCACACAGGGR